MKPATHILAIICLSVFALAEPVSQLQPMGYVSDFAHVLTPETISQLNNLARELDDKAHAQIAVVTIHSLDGSDVESYAVDLFKKWGVGNKSTNRGVLILYAIKDRRARVEVGYGLEPILPDGKVGGFQREAIPLLRQGDYSGAISLVTNRVAETIAQDAGVQLANAQPRAPAAPEEQPSRTFPPALIFLVIVVVLLVLLTPLRRLLFWWLFGQVISGGGRGGWGGGGGFGGFGGGSGGSDFGGFGGGSSGGGGASSSW